MALDRHHPDDDVEANAVQDFGTSNGYGGADDKDLDEYAKLDRFITTFDASGGHRSAEVEEKKEIPKWWQIWKSVDDDSAQFDGKPPPHWLETDIHHGIGSGEVAERRRRFGWNELTAEKENQFRKFLSFFQGPILYGEFSKTDPMLCGPVFLMHIADSLHVQSSHGNCCSACRRS